MRREITFEQCSLTHCLSNTKNIFGSSIDYVEDSIKVSLRLLRNMMENGIKSLENSKFRYLKCNF